MTLSVMAFSGDSNIIGFRTMLGAADTSTSRAGKVRGQYLPPEVELSRFVRFVQNPHPTWKANKSIKEWVGVQTTDAGFEILWGGFELRGRVDWSHLPLSTVKLYIGKGIRRGKLRDNRLQDMIDFSVLPHELKEFSVESDLRGDFFGALDFTRLPPKLYGLNIEHNRFDGIIDLTQLPPNIEYAWLAYNFFSGRVNFSMLPRSLSVLSLSRNTLFYSSRPKCVEIYNDVNPYHANF